MAKEKAEGIKVVARNKKARFDYELMEKFEAGLVLQGSEVKSIRDGRVSLNESYARERRGELFVVNLDISPYKFAGSTGHEPKRVRKLLLHRHEIDKILGKLRERGLTLIPTSLYFKGGRAKLEIALARRKLKGDKRASLKKKESDRELRKRSLRT